MTPSTPQDPEQGKAAEEEQIEAEAKQAEQQLPVEAASEEAETPKPKRARRKATRFWSCSAIDCATSFASSSGRLISRMLTLICFRVMRCRSLRRASTSLPDLPITMPGRAVWMLTSTSLASLRIVMSDRPACASLPVICPRMRVSSSR